MKFRIKHDTVYKFSSEVFLEPHYLRFKPKTAPNRELKDFQLNVFPQPAGISEQIDSENNIVHFCWFDGMSTDLTIKSESIVEIQEYNPFNFILHPQEYNELPFTYSGAVANSLQSALEVQGMTDSLLKYGQKILNQSNSQTIEFLTNLTRQIHSDFIIKARELGEPYSPGQTLKVRTGSCRDVAWMQIHLLRDIGIASRFVSGYFYPIVKDPQFELHAWVEVFLPGAGWVGFDPSNGILVGNSHIPIATSSQFENTMSVTGSIRGSASSMLTTQLLMELIK